RGSPLSLGQGRFFYSSPTLEAARGALPFRLMQRQRTSAARERAMVHEGKIHLELERAGFFLAAACAPKAKGKLILARSICDLTDTRIFAGVKQNGRRLRAAARE